MRWYIHSTLGGWRDSSIYCSNELKLFSLSKNSSISWIYDNVSLWMVNLVVNNLLLMSSCIAVYMIYSVLKSFNFILD